MATTTPIYGWPVPTSTDLVKDGATAIEALGDAIDATVGGLGSSAFVKINTTTFSAVASQSFNNVFSATYDAYRIVVRYTAASANTSSHFRLRVANADDTNVAYGNRSFYYQSNIIQGYANISDTLYNFGQHGTGNFLAVMDISSPQLTQQTLINTSAINIATFVGGGCAFTNTTSFTGFTIFPNSGTITGTVRVYGVQN